MGADSGLARAALNAGRRAPASPRSLTPTPSTTRARIFHRLAHRSRPQRHRNQYALHEPYALDRDAGAGIDRYRRVDNEPRAHALISARPSILSTPMRSLASVRILDFVRIVRGRSKAS